jgi:site-specific recombinase XerD
MGRRRLPARLILRPARPGKQRALWIIRDGSREIGTGCGADARKRAEEALQSYLAKTYQPPITNRPAELSVADVMVRYLSEHATTKPTKTQIWLADMATDILNWWGTKTLADINGRNCRAYVEHRMSQPIRRYTKSVPRNVSRATCRNELLVLKASINYFHREYGPLASVPAVTLPSRTPARPNYFLTRAQVAQRIREARRRPETQHLVRFLLVSLYSGSRPGTTLTLRWLPSTDAGWIDVDGGVIHRKPPLKDETTKRQPPARIHQRLLRHLRHWRRIDDANGAVNVVHYGGSPVRDIKGAWKSVARRAGHAGDDAPHVCRHSSATMYMQWGLDIAEIAGFLGMSAKTLNDVYGHHHPMFQSRIASSGPRHSPRLSANGNAT